MFLDVSFSGLIFLLLCQAFIHIRKLYILFLLISLLCSLILLFDRYRVS